MPHLAGTEGDGPLWLTCGEMRYEVPDQWTTLGTPDAVEIAAARPADSTGCMGCGRDVACTGSPVDDSMTRWVCYRCGTVGWYRESVRENYDPATDAVPDDAVEILAGSARQGTELADELAATFHDPKAEVTDPKLPKAEPQPWEAAAGDRDEPEPDPWLPHQAWQASVSLDDVHAALAELRGHDPPRQLRIEPPERAGSTAVTSGLPDPDSPEGDSLGAVLRRTRARIELWIVGAG